MTDKRIFDTAVQKLKYDVLKAVIRNEYEHCYENIYIDIPKEISPGPKATMRISPAAPACTSVRSARSWISPWSWKALIF